MKKLFLSAAIFLFTALTSHAQVSVVTAKSSPDMSLDAVKLSNIYSLVLTKWDNGSKIVLFDNSTGDVRSKFYSFISKDPMAVKKIWLKKQLMGEGKAPDILSSDGEVIMKVAATPGAIGFVKSSSVNDQVKVLLEIK